MRSYPERAEVAVDVVPNVDFAIRCVPQLHASAMLREEHNLLYRGPLDISLADDHYRIRVESAREDLL